MQSGSFAYKQILVAIYERSKASKALKGFCRFLYKMNAPALRSNQNIKSNIFPIPIFRYCAYQKKAVILHPNSKITNNRDV